MSQDPVISLDPHKVFALHISHESSSENVSSRAQKFYFSPAKKGLQMNARE